MSEARTTIPHVAGTTAVDGVIGRKRGYCAPQTWGVNNMSNNPMASAVALCGVGLCLIGGAILVQGGGAAQAGASLPGGVAGAVAAATMAQGTEPTVVWYGVAPGSYGSSGSRTGVLFRAWSDGTVEGRFFDQMMSDGYDCGTQLPSCTSWSLFSTPAQGLAAASDVNADEKVDGADLSMLLGNWGDAPRVPFPPSDCPLNLINP